jgi:hypothetical protein
MAMGRFGLGREEPMLRGRVLAGVGVGGAERVFVALGMCLALLLGPASGQAAGASGTTTCAGAVNSSEFNDVRVPHGARCGLVGDTIDGNVFVGHDARFTAIGTLIKGSVSTQGAETVSLINSEVYGDASFDMTSGPTTFFCLGGGIGDSVCLGPADKFFSNVTITNTSPATTVVVHDFVAGNLTCIGNASVTNDEEMNTVLGRERGQCVGL